MATNEISDNDILTPAFANEKQLIDLCNSYDPTHPLRGSLGGLADPSLGKELNQANEQVSE